MQSRAGLLPPRKGSAVQKVKNARMQAASASLHPQLYEKSPRNLPGASLLYLVYSSLNVGSVEHLVSLVAAGLLKEFLVNLLDSGIFVRLSQRH